MIMDGQLDAEVRREGMCVGRLVEGCGGRVGGEALQ